EGVRTKPEILLACSADCELILCLNALFHGIDAAVRLAFRGTRSFSPVGFLHAVERRFVTKPAREDMVCDHGLLQQCESISEGIRVGEVESLGVLFEHLDHRPMYDDTRASPKSARQ